MRVFVKRGVYFTALVFVVTLLAVTVGEPAFIAKALGISTASALTVVKLLDAYQNVALVIAIVGAITGVGSISAGILAAALRILKRYGQYEAAMF